MNTIHEERTNGNSVSLYIYISPNPSPTRLMYRMPATALPMGGLQPSTTTRITGGCRVALVVESGCVGVAVYLWWRRDSRRCECGSAAYDYLWWRRILRRGFTEA